MRFCFLYLKLWISNFKSSKMATPGDNNSKDLKCPEVKRGLKRKRISLENMEAVRRDLLDDVAEHNCEVESTSRDSENQLVESKVGEASTNDSGMFIFQMIS